MSGYQLLCHRDQFVTEDPEKRKLLVESDEMTYVLIATKHDIKNLIGRTMRKAGAEPITSLAETLSSAAALGAAALSEEGEEG